MTPSSTAPARLGFAAFVLIALLALAAPATAARTTLPYDETEISWFRDRPVRLFIKLPTGPPDPALPALSIYLIAPVDAAAPLDPGGIFFPPPNAPPGLPPIAIPAHDQTLERLSPQPANCFGFFVVPGPAATPETVLSREDPNIAGLPFPFSGIRLAYAIVVDGRTRLLTSPNAIQAGLASGLLSLVPLGYGGTCWSAFPTWELRARGE